MSFGAALPLGKARTSLAGGLGSFSPSSVSETQLPRSDGLVRDAPDSCVCTLAEPEACRRDQVTARTSRRGGTADR